MSFRDGKQDQQPPFALSAAPPDHLSSSCQRGSPTVTHRLVHRPELPHGTLQNGRAWDLFQPAWGARAADLSHCDIYSKDQGMRENSR